jgi:hypothetical protein
VLAARRERHLAARFAADLPLDHAAQRIAVHAEPFLNVEGGLAAAFVE